MGGGRTLIRKLIHDVAKRSRFSSPVCTSANVMGNLRVSFDLKSNGQMQFFRSFSALSNRGLALSSSPGHSHYRENSGAAELQGSFLTCDAKRIVRIHIGRVSGAHVEPSYGVGPVGGADRDPKTKGSTPDDFRADYIRMAEPKEITKEKAAAAQQEPPDFQVKKAMPQWEKPVEEKADTQREPGDEVFKGRTRKLGGTAQKHGDTTGNESGETVESEYGATSVEGTTRRG